MAKGEGKDIYAGVRSYAGKIGVKGSSVGLAHWTRDAKDIDSSAIISKGMGMPAKDLRPERTRSDWPRRGQ